MSKSSYFSAQVFLTGDRADNAWNMSEELLLALSDVLGDFLGATVVIAAVCPNKGKLGMQL